MIAGAPRDDRVAAVAGPAGRRPLDCTGGWWSEQSWDAVPLATSWAILRAQRAGALGHRLRPAFLDRHRSTMSTSRWATRASRCGGQGAGAPRRARTAGPWWVKWVTSVEPDDRPAWLQLPLPPSLTGRWPTNSVSASLHSRRTSVEPLTSTSDGTGRAQDGPPSRVVPGGDNPYDRDPAPDFGLYLDERWDPP